MSLDLTSRPVEFKLYDLPRSVAEQSGYTNIGIKQLDTQDELGAAERCRGNPIRLATELAKASLYSADGEQLKDGDGTRDTVWEKLGQRGRQLVLMAFQQDTTLPEDEVNAFLSSKRQAV